METTPSYAPTELPLAARVEDITRHLSGLREFLLTFAVREPASSVGHHALEAVAPEGLEIESPELQTICEAGFVLTAALVDSATAHQALDACLLFDQVSRIDPEFASGVPAFEVIDAMDAETIIEGSDALLATKMLRLVCGRAASGADKPLQYFRKYLPKLVAMGDSANPEDMQLYDDLVEAMAAQAALGTDEEAAPQQQLLTAFLQELGYDARPMIAAWIDGTPYDERLFMEINILNMMALERREQGLCRKITDVFRTRNFSRNSVEVFADMYYERLAHPETPYVLSLLATYEHNFSSGVAGVAKARLYGELKQRGLRFEEYECASIDEIGEAAYGARQLHSEHGGEIVDLVLEGHSDRTRVALSFDEQHEEYELLNASNVWYLWGFRDVMRKDARAFLRCCQSGDKRKDRDPCVAESVARVLGHETVAPAVSAASMMSIRETDGNARIDMKYIAARPVWHRFLMLPLLDLEPLLRPTLQEFSSPRTILPLVIPAVIFATRNVGTRRRFVPAKPQE